VTPTLIRGRGGIFEIHVHKERVAKKEHGAFPTDEEVVHAVQRALTQ
jgi:hypothetical protein